MITPVTQSERIRELPTIEIPRTVRILGRSLGAIVRVVRRHQRKVAGRSLSKMLRRVGESKDREELESFVGKPIYVLDGQGFSSQSPDGQKLVPDFLERYEADEYWIDLWFEQGRVVTFSGCLRWSAWDLASGLAR